MRICIFAGAGGNQADIEAAYDMGLALALDGHELVTGGSKRGIMGAISDGAITGQGKVLGVLPELIHKFGNCHGTADIMVVKDMFERKRVFWTCDAFLCMPGGVGTMDELWEVGALIKLGFIPRKPVVVFEPDGKFYEPVRSMLANMEAAGYLKDQSRGLFTFVTSVPWAVQELSR